MSEEEIKQLNMTQLSAYYSKWRAKAEEMEIIFEASQKKLKAQMVLFLAEIETRLNAKDEKNIQMPEGTFYFTTKKRTSKVNGNQFLEFMKANDLFDLATFEPNKNVCVKYIDEHDIVPTGVEYLTWKELVFKRNG